MKRWLLFALMIVVLGSCGLGTRMPKRGPITAAGRISPQGNVSLTASLNCAFPGEEVMFDLEMMNNEPTALTLLGTPLIDIALSDGNKEVLWSQSSSYPTDINPVLQAGERRQYQWRWIATDLDGSMGAVVFMNVKSPGSAASRPTELILPMGINIMQWTVGGSPMPIACTELRS